MSLLINLPSTKNVSLKTINSFVEEFMSIPRDESYMCFHFMNACEEIKNAQTFKEKHNKFIEVIRHLASIKSKKRYFGQEIDFRTWKIGRIALPFDNKYRIEKCPMCGKNGVYLPPYRSYKGMTLHVIKPFAMGCEDIVVCEPQSEEEQLAEWMKDFGLTIDEQGNFVKANL